jgi:DNA-binding SARP family transcriptional activator
MSSRATRGCSSRLHPRSEYARAVPPVVSEQDPTRRAAACVRILGAVRFVSDDGEAIDLPSASQRRLLAALALAAGATLRPEYLSDLLDVTPGALRTAVSRLRSRLGEQTICTDAVGYRVTCSVDATTFTDLLITSPKVPDRLAALDDALALWDGEALDEFRHETWADAEATRLDELRCVAIEDRAELLADRGRAGEAVAALEAHIAGHPLRDRARGLLIRALASDGRQADALRAFQDYRALLAEETGTEPSALVRSIERRVAAGWSGDHDDADDPTAPPAGATDASAQWSVPLPGALTRGAPLIGRRREITWLESDLVQARAGSFRVVILSGEAGIGKTTLLGAFARARDGDGTNAIVYGRCDEGAAVPLQPFRDAMGALVDSAPNDVLVAHCERFGGELTRIAPRLTTRVWAPPPIIRDEATERYQLFESVADLLRRLAATGPVTLMLDDLHWAEPTALLLLRHLARALSDAPVLVVASMRDTGEQSTDLIAALADLERGHARRISLLGFDDAELSDLVASVTDAPSTPADDLLEQLRHLTAGNPLYAVQLVRHLVEAGHLVADDKPRADALTDGNLPASLLDVVLTRVRALGDVTHDVLQAGAVLGVEFDENTLAQMTDAGDDDVTNALDAALEAGLLVESDELPVTMRFAHALVAHALYSALRGPRRRRMHERAARVLQKSTDELPQKTVVDLARHCALAGDLPDALRWSTAAGDYALDHLAPSEAARWYETALEHASALNLPEPDRADLMVRRGVAQSRAGDIHAREGLFEAAEMARRSGADDVLIRAALALDRGLTRVGAVDAEQLAIVEAAIAVADPSDASIYARLLALHALELIATPDFELRQAQARHALELIDASSDPTLLLRTMAALTFALEGPSTLTRRRELAVRAVDTALAIQDPFLQFWTNRAAYFVAIESADAPLAEQNLDRMRAISSEVGEPRLRWVTAIYDTFDAMMRARLDDAERHSEIELELGMQLGEPDAFSLYAGQLFAMRSFAGRYDELLPLLEGIMEANPGFLPFRLAYGISCLAADRRDEARAILDEGAANGFSSMPRDYLWITSAIGYAVMAIDLQDTEMAAQLYPLLLPYSEEVAFSGATSQGPISAYLGKLASLIGDHLSVDQYLHQALGMAEAFGWEYHRATTLVALALSQQRRTGALDDEAFAWLDEATAIGSERDLSIVLSQVHAVRG